MDLTVRRAGPADAETLARFGRRLARETEDKTLDPATIRAGVRSVSEKERGAFYLVAEAPDDSENGSEDGRETAGALMVTREWSDWRDGMFWWIQSVYVRPAHRRQGVYRALYRDVRRRAIEAPDVCGLRLYVERDNAAARAAYEALGMQQTSYRLYETGL